MQIALNVLGAVGQALTRATLHGRPVFGGTIREINNGAPMHCDEVVPESPGAVFEQRVIAQLAFNVWAAVPHAGGETRCGAGAGSPATRLTGRRTDTRPTSSPGARSTASRPDSARA